MNWYESHMNIVVVIAGRGSRFEDWPVKLPKPMIPVQHKTILERTTESLPFFKKWDQDRLWFAVLQEHVDNYGIDKWLREVYGKNIHVVILPKVSRGNLDTAHIAVTELLSQKPGAMDYPLLILDGDNAYDGSRILDGFDAKLDAWEDYAIIYYFQPTNDDSHWAFAMLRRDRVWDIQEKNPHAPFCGGKPMVGVFFFSNVRLFLEAADTVLKRGIKTANEFFMSQAVKQLLDDDIPVLGQEVTDVIPLGTPQDVEQYLLSVSGNVPKKKLRICLDLDDTINYCKKPEEEYGNEEPQERAVEVIRKWKSQGHYIIIQTARHMNTCNGNVGQVVARQGLTTLEWLNKYNVPFDELWFGKPHADVFIDDKAIRHEKGNWAATEMAINSFIQTRSV